MLGSTYQHIDGVQSMVELRQRPQNSLLTPLSASLAIPFQVAFQVAIILARLVAKLQALVSDPPYTEFYKNKKLVCVHTPDFSLK